MKKLCLSVCAIGLLASNAISQNVELDSSIVSASGFTQDIKEAPATINVITKKNYKVSLIEMLQRLSQISQALIYMLAREKQVLIISLWGVLLDILWFWLMGVVRVLAERWALMVLMKFQILFLPPISSIERIEVIKGPMSTLYGSEALGGVVNIITKK